MKKLPREAKKTFSTVCIETTGEWGADSNNSQSRVAQGHQI